MEINIQHKSPFEETGISETLNPGYCAVIIDDIFKHKAAIQSSDLTTTGYFYEKYFITSDKPIETGLCIKNAEKTNMDVNSVKNSIIQNFSEMNQIKAVYFLLQEDYIEIYTVLNTRNRRIRNSLFSHQLRIHDQFPDILLDFNVVFSVSDDEINDIPSDATVCIFR